MDLHCVNATSGLFVLRVKEHFLDASWLLSYCLDRRDKPVAASEDLIEVLRRHTIISKKLSLRERITSTLPGNLSLLLQCSNFALTLAEVRPE